MSRPHLRHELRHQARRAQIEWGVSQSPAHGWRQGVEVSPHPDMATCGDPALSLIDLVIFVSFAACHCERTVHPYISLGEFALFSMLSAFRVYGCTLPRQEMRKRTLELSDDVAALTVVCSLGRVKNVWVDLVRS